MKLHDLSVPVSALTSLTARNDLPAADIAVNPLFPDRLEISFHNDPTAFCQWLTALKLTPQDGTAWVKNDTAWVTITTSYAGADLKLTSFTSLGE